MGGIWLCLAGVPKPTTPLSEKRRGGFWAVGGIEKKCPFEVILVLSWGDSTTPAFGVTIGGYDACMSEGVFVS